MSWRCQRPSKRHARVGRQSEAWSLAYLQQLTCILGLCFTRPLASTSLALVGLSGRRRTRIGVVPSARRPCLEEVPVLTALKAVAFFELASGCFLREGSFDCLQHADSSRHRPRLLAAPIEERPAAELLLLIVCYCIRHVDLPAATSTVLHASKRRISVQRMHPDASYLLVARPRHLALDMQLLSCC